MIQGLSFCALMCIQGMAPAMSSVAAPRHISGRSEEAKMRMRKLVVSQFVSLDGIAEDPGGSEGSKHGAWTFQFDRGEDGNRFKYDELMASDVLLLGRVTYEGFAAAWPNRSGDEFSDKFNSMTKY